MPLPKMKQVRGVWIPESDNHFQAHLEAGPEFQGRGTYQFAKIEKALGLTNKRGLALDIGAHVGLWSMVLAKHFAKVIAYEPLPSHIACFRRNLEFAGNVDLRTYALGDEERRTFVKGGGDNSGNAHITPKGEFGGAAVPMQRLSDQADDPEFGTIMEHTHLIKIDTEGYEVPVLLGGEALIRDIKPAIVVEQKPNNAERYGYDRLGAVRLLESWGAKVVWEKSGDYGLAW